MNWQDAPEVPATPAAPPVAWDSVPADLPVITDDGTVWAPGQISQGSLDAPLAPGQGGGFLHALAHPVETLGQLSGANTVVGLAKGIANGFADPFRLTHDVATGKIDMNDPAQQAGLIPRAANAGLMMSPVAGASIKSGIPIAPSIEDRYAAASRGFDNFRDQPLEYPPEPFRDFAVQQQQDLLKNGIRPTDTGAPGLHGELSGMANIPPGALPVTPADIDAQRKAFGNVAQNGANNTERSAARRIRDAFVDLAGSTTPSSTVAGAPSSADAIQGLKDAVANHASAARGDLLDTLDENAELANERAHSGHNGGNTLRQQVASVLRLNPRTGTSLADRSGLNDDEQAALHNVVQGGPIRTLSNIAGGGLGHAGMIGGILAAKEGYEAGGLPGAVAGASIPFIGTGLRSLDEALARRRLAAAQNLIGLRSPLAQTASTPGPAVFPSVTNKLVRALAASQEPQPNAQQ